MLSLTGTSSHSIVPTTGTSTSLHGQTQPRNPTCLAVVQPSRVLARLKTSISQNLARATQQASNNVESPDPQKTTHFGLVGGRWTFLGTNAPLTMHHNTKTNHRPAQLIVTGTIPFSTWGSATASASSPATTVRPPVLLTSTPGIDQGPAIAHVVGDMMRIVTSRWVTRNHVD
ncbi:hypothetical protein BCR44DRAFT_1427424 [Catenaria anguillulae PL171]|uniref:Uncharacterized protein n=1 Tax=Catenaria anguillulae PL171 TaxID=765915 RepID=A0A1Y2HZ20_9FUNG|nr:hypothetical protein BCR44DRAFT_1427424 [Catenaria anguillulae PL171]